MKTVLIVIPAYNEGEKIGEFLDQVLQEPICDIADILVIDDGSKDNTREKGLKRGVHVVTHCFNLGYARALQTGYKFAAEGSYEYLIQIDGDGQHASQNLEIIYRELTLKEADIVIGSRFKSQENTLKPSPVKLIAIKYFRWVIKWFTKKKITDPTSGLQGMNRKIFTYNAKFEHIFNEYPDANLILQLLLNDYRVKEIGAIMYPRETGKSMHAGLEPVIYMLTMSLSMMIVVLREKIFHQKKRKKSGC